MRPSCRSGPTRPITTAVVTASLAITAHTPILLIAAIVLVLLVYAGVVLPAIWCRHPARRQDARAVLQQLLNIVRQPRSP
jgi:hypothetical protein